jgi:integrase
MNMLEAMDLYIRDNQARLKSLMPNFYHFKYVCKWFKRDEVETFDVKRIFVFIKYQMTRKQNKNRTINRYLYNLSSVFGHLKNLGIIKENPVKKEFFLKEYETEMRIFSDEEYAKMVTHESKIKGILLCALTAGLRHSEIARLRWDNINMREKVIKIFNDTKTFQGRVIPLSKFFYDWLEKQSVKEGYIFPAYNDIRKRRKTLFYFINKHIRDSGVEPEGRGLQAMRHTFATMLIKKGVDVRIVQDLLGHKSLNTTMRYTHVDNKMRESAISKLCEELYE